MSKITELKYKSQKNAGKVILEEAIKRLQSAIELKDQGKEAEGDKAVNEMKVWLDEEIEKLEKKKRREEAIVIERSSLPELGEKIARGNKVTLGVLNLKEKEQYLEVNYVNSHMKEIFKDEKFREEIWKDFISDETFVCSIYERQSGKYVGYCSVKRLIKDDWELAIELFPDACHKGYGTEALFLLMQVLHKITGRRYYYTKVEIDNHASQGLMKKLGAIPNGISEFLIYGEEIEKFRQDYKHMITDEIRSVANEFCMEAEDILGYVLEYRFDVENLKQ